MSAQNDLFTHYLNNAEAYEVAEFQAQTSTLL